MHLKDRLRAPEDSEPTMIALEQKYGGHAGARAERCMQSRRFSRTTRTQRSDSGAAPEVRQRFRASTSILRNPPPIQIGGQVTNSPYQFTLQSPDTEELYRRGDGFRAEDGKRFRHCRT